MRVSAVAFAVVAGCASKSPAPLHGAGAGSGSEARADMGVLEAARPALFEASEGLCNADSQLSWDAELVRGRTFAAIGCGARGEQVIGVFDYRDNVASLIASFRELDAQRILYETVLAEDRRVCVRYRKTDPSNAVIERCAPYRW